MNNLDIRFAVARAGLRLYQVADALKMAPSNFSFKLRKELPVEEKERIFAVVNQLSESRK